MGSKEVKNRDLSTPPCLSLAYPQARLSIKNQWGGAHLNILASLGKQ